LTVDKVIFSTLPQLPGEFVICEGFVG
jgi:hypothetical protein